MTKSATDGEVVIIGFADALAAIESTWSLADHGYTVIAFARQGQTTALERSHHASVVPICPPEVNLRRCLDDLDALFRAVQPAAVLPLDDFAVWLCDRLATIQDTGRLPGGALLAGPTGRCARFALDKREQVSAARLAGLLVPPTTDAAPAGGGAGPWMVKPALAVAECAGQLVRSNGRVARTHSEIGEIAATVHGPVLVQPQIDGVGEGIFGVAGDGWVTGWSAHRRIRMMHPRGSGSSACKSVAVDDELRVAIERLIMDIGWRGMFMIELLRGPDGSAWFMELNGRPWGSMALARRRGFDYPVWNVRNAMDPAYRPAPPAAAPDLVCRNLGRELMHLALVLRGPRSGDGQGWPRRWETLRSMTAAGTTPQAWYNHRHGDRRVFWADAYYTVRSRFPSRRHGRSSVPSAADAMPATARP